MKENMHLFILSPPYSGSTLLTKLLNSSDEVSVNNTISGTMEGQKLPEIRKMYEGQLRWDTRCKLDWLEVKKVWYSYWDVSKTYLLEKSPPNLVRAKEMVKYFEPYKIIILVRHPYAIFESLLNRNQYSIDGSAKWTAKYFNLLSQNTTLFPEAFLLRYEDLTTDSAIVIQKIKEFLPKLGDIAFDESYEIHNSSTETLSSSLKNYNQDKISRLSGTQKAVLRSMFKADLLQFIQKMDYVL